MSHFCETSVTLGQRVFTTLFSDDLIALVEQLLFPDEAGEREGEGGVDGDLDIGAGVAVTSRIHSPSR